MSKLKQTYGKAQEDSSKAHEDSWQSIRSLMEKLKKTHGYSRRLMAKPKKSHGKAQEVSWPSSRKLCGQAQENSWQSSIGIMGKLKVHYNTSRRY